jgi:3'-5' exoribonuclease
VSASKLSVTRLADLVPGQQADFFALLLEKSRSATRDGKPFYTCRFGDRQRAANFMAWADGGWFEVCERQWREGKCYKIRGTFGEHGRYGGQIEIAQIREVSESDREAGFDPAELVERSRFDAAAMWTELLGLARDHIADASLRRLVLLILERHQQAIQRVPATQRHFYPFVGGLLEHTLSVTRTSLHLVGYYRQLYPELRPPLNQDLVVAGAILHDTGRLLEFDPDSTTGELTVAGRLLGHLFLGRDLIRDTARELGDVNPELLQLLEHLIVSHLNLPEWGSPRLPLIPESLILHHADDLDAKLEMYCRCLTRDQQPELFTARDPVLGRSLFKGRSI